MPDIDYDILETANKSLTVAFIVAIVLANCHLIGKIVKKGGCLYTPKSLTLISLAIGDIFVALFSLVVHARILYDNLSLPCNTYRAYYVYMRFLIHFVFGCELIVLTAELVHRYRTQQPAGRQTTSIIKSILFSICPWIMGLLVVLPLTMVGVTTEWYPCFKTLTKERQHAMYGVSVILPAALSLVVVIAAYFVRIPPNHYFNVNYQVTEETGLSNASSRQGITVQYNTTSQNLPNAIVEKCHFSPDNTVNLRGQGYAVSQYTVTQYPVQQHYPVQYTAQSNVVFAAPVNQLQPGPVFPNPGKERKLLGVTSIVYCICVLPLAVYTIGTLVMDYNISSTDVILSTSFFWLSLFRSFLTPCILSDSPTYI